MDFAYRKLFFLFTGTLLCCLSAAPLLAGLDAPHNSAEGLGCLSCHDMTSTLPKLMPSWIAHSPTSIDDTLFNSMCWSCHNDSRAPYVKTHSSLTTSDRYGDWTVECWVCHNLHIQQQLRTYGSAGYLHSAASTGVTATTLSQSGADWEDDEFAGMVLVPDTANINYNYTITGNTTDTLTVQGPMDLTRIIPGNTFGIVLGKLIRSTINVGLITDPLHPENKTGYKTVRYFRREGANSFADGNATFDGICEVCHTETKHFQNDGTSDDPEHDNLGSVAGSNCTTCHNHENGFAHGGGSGTGCIECHGHDAGTFYDPDMSAPYAAGATASPGRGTVQSHSTHTETVGDDLKGPGIYCDTCHNIQKFPLFRSVADPNAELTLAETDVCDACHSEGGTYDGLDDPAVGAKAIWKTGAYVSTSDSTLRSDKQKWCATCHDESPSMIATVSAPNVIGDEDGTYTYGTGWGYYKTGHGLPASETYPASGGLTPGVGAGCGDCHDLATAHIDGLARTFDDHESSATAPSEYRIGYRLRLIGGQEPMIIPKTGRAEASNSRLCFSCHTDSTPYTTAALGGTNFQDGTNRHFYHMDLNDQLRFKADWGGDNYDGQAYTSRITCITCHNVHGSTRLTMIRDGKLINRENGIETWYYNPAISTDTAPPFPEDLPLPPSTGLIWLPATSGKVCLGCHGGSTRELFNRGLPYQDTAQAPRLDWTGENGYVADGSSPDTAPSGSSFTFRVKYTDTNNDAPTVIELWIDADNNGTFESTYPMAGINDGDTTYINGKIYSSTLVLTNSGSNIINYRYYAKEATDREATGPATGAGSVTLTALPLATAPTLTWVSGSCRFEGVSPLAETSGTVFAFRVQYTDANNDAPTTTQLWVDLNDDGDYDDTVDGNDEKQAMTVEGGDGDYRNGEIFTRSLPLNYHGDGRIPYRFAFADGTEAASGDPAVDHKVTIIDTATTPLTVCGSGCDYTTIQAAIDAIDGAHTVLVYQGTYNEKVYFNGGNDNNTIVRSACGPDETIINASGATTYGVEVTGSTGSVVDGFGIADGTIGVYLHHSSASTNVTIENCRIHNNSGGGIYCGDTSSMTVNNSEVYANTAGTGAGIYLLEGSSSINDTLIRNNTATMNGGGVATGLWNNTTFTNTTIKDNTAAGSGGGLAQISDSSTATFYNSTVIGNEATAGSGGGMYIQGESGTYGVNLTNTVVADNQAPSGGGIWLDGNLTAINCTIADNRATGSAGGGGAIYANTGGSVTIRNSILWNNAAPILGSRHIAYLSSTTPTVISDSILNNDGTAAFNLYPYFVVQSGGALPTITGFVSGADPFFADTANGDYHILATSPAIDNANAAYAPAVDLDGDARPQGAADDIGSDEYRSATGNQAPVLIWTGEANYTTDGVNPDSGDLSTSFVFRTDYLDADNEAPLSLQVWIDINDNGSYGADEKFAMAATDSGDTTYADGKRYAKTLVLAYAGDGLLTYRFYASDGTSDATGPPTSNKTVMLSNAVPTLSWTGEANYATDGIDPASGIGGSNFIFRVDYSDADNVTPALIQVWVDLNDDGDYEDAGEKLAMIEADAGDANYTDGKRYSKSLNIYYAGDGILNYRFYARDSADEATGPPAAEASVTVANNIPSLSFTGETNYTGDGVHPDSATTGSSFEFRVDYTEADNTPPAPMQVWADLNDDGDYDDPGEKLAMIEADAGDANYTDGKRYSKSLIVYYAGDGILNYRFYATDGADEAVGEGTSEKQLTVEAVANNAPVLAWTAADCLTEGVRPRTGAVNADFEFRVLYSDADGNCPTSIQVRVNGTPYDLTGNDGASCQTGRTYYRSIAITDTGDLDYSISASDGLSAATGSPVTNHVVSVINTPLVVRPSGGTYNTIQAAVNASSDPSTILVYPNSDFTAATYNEDVQISGKSNRKIQSVCGSAATIIDGTTNTLYIYNASANTEIDGFTIQGSSNFGVRVDSKPVIIRNCKVTGNTTRGISTVTAGNTDLTLANVEISENGASTQDGAGLYLAGGTHSITDTVIMNNTTSARGGGIIMQNGAGATFSRVSVTGNRSTANSGGGMFLMTTGTTIFENVVIAGNQAATSGGGVYIQSGSNSSFINVTFADNQATTSGGAIYLLSVTTTVRNSIFWNNAAPSGSNIQKNFLSSCGPLSYSDVATGPGWTDYCTFTDITDNIDPAQDPLFVGGTPFDYHLQAGSPVIDQASATYAPAFDIDGDARPQGVGDDMGADEYMP